jgi:hypothetical protein
MWSGALSRSAFRLPFNTVWSTAIQREIPPGELSRVSSWDYLGSLALQPVGQAVSGPIAVAIGVSATLYGAGALTLVLLVAVLAVPAVRTFGLRAEPGRATRPLV